MIRFRGYPADRGSGTVLILSVLAVVATVLVAVSAGGQAVLARRQAELAADLAAVATAHLVAAQLTPAVAGRCPQHVRQAADVAAEGNRAAVQSCVIDCGPGSGCAVTVTVAFALPGGLAPWGPVAAAARAGPSPP